MITVRLQGGLGNQMFQYAFGKAVSKHLNATLALDISFYKTSTNRHYELNSFDIKADIKSLKNFQRWGRKMNEKDIPGPDAYKKIPDGKVIEGYWQNENHFKHVEDDIRREFTLTQPLDDFAKSWETKIKRNEAVSIHIRRGDYLSLKHKHIGVLPTSYYENAAQIISERVASPVFYIFSDDVHWVKENLKLPFSAEFVSSLDITAAEEMMLMSYCKHNIIANSSFSWWGAWLNANPEKIVIAPKQWFADTTKNTANNIVPERWIRI